MNIKAILLLVSIAWLSVAYVHADDDPCSGHGELINDTCHCSNIKPEPNGPQGYVGRTCNVPVYPFLPSSTSLNVSASPSCGKECSFLQAGQLVCFYIPLGQTLSSHATISILLHAKDCTCTSKFSAFGVWTNDDQNAPYPSGSEARNFILSPTAAEPISTLTLTRSSIGSDKATGLYICASSDTTNVTYDLLFAVESCPSRLTPDGTILKCGSSGPDDKRHNEDDTCPLGTCLCHEPWARPSTPVYPSILGFDDCTASIEKVEGHLDPNAAPIKVNAQAPGTWHYFSFQGQKPNVLAVATATLNTSSDLELYFKLGQVPGRELGQFDAKSSLGDFRKKPNRADLSSSVSLSHARDGPWFLGVYSTGSSEPVSYDLSLHQSICPNNCFAASNRGDCNVTSAKCECNKEEFTGDDCGTTSASIELAHQFTSEARPGLFTDAIEVKLGAAAKSSGLVHFSITTAFTPDSILPEWVTDRPVLLVSGSAPTTVDDADKRLLLDHVEQTVTISALSVTGKSLFVSLYNPLSFYSIGYTIKVEAVATCLNACSEQGTCGAEGDCTCNPGFLGTDCSVDAAKVPGTPRDCIEGTMNEDGPVPGGKSFGVCICANATDPDSCSYSPNPLVVTCSGGFELRGVVEDLVKLSDGRKLPGGGSCMRIKRGTSGGMVFFYCVLSIGLAAALVVGSKMGLERYLIWRQSNVGYDSMGGSGNKLWDAFLGRAQQPQNDDW